LIANDTHAPIDYLIEKEESPPLPVAAVSSSSAENPHLLSGGRLSSPLRLTPGERRTIRILYSNNCSDSPDGRSPQRAFCTRARRYLSEVRDNYISKNRLLLSCATKLKNGLFP
jgi:hypothetical protein